MQVPVALLSWTGLAYVRHLYGDTTIRRDCILFAVVELWASWSARSDIVTRGSSTPWIVLHLAGLTTYWLVRSMRSEGKPRVISSPEEIQHTYHQSSLKPLIFPSRTTHTRMFPSRHSFSYSYFYVGIPIGWHGSVKNILSADCLGSNAWFHVSAADYLERGLPGLDLKQKLAHYLASQSEDIESFPFAYLVTAPRFLGYSFNPVSFWYLYSESHELQAMILEVNNTFDERRIYLLKMGNDCGAPSKDTLHVFETTIAQKGISDREARRKTRFSNAWTKDFHVSPFNSRQGSYHLVAVDPCADGKTEHATVSNTITLVSSEGRTKLVARVFSDAVSIDPAKLKATAMFALIVQYGWIGLLTFPRILRQAWTLYFKLKLEVFYRPEVVNSSIARQPTEVETRLESFFCRYLEYTVARLGEDIRVIYKPVPGMGAVQSFTSKTFERLKSGQEAATLTLEIISPVFYSRFTSHAHALEAFDKEFLCADAKSKTAHVTRPQLLPILFATTRRTANFATGMGMVEAARWSVLQKLRYRRSAQGEVAMSHRRDIRHFPLSPCDTFVMLHCKGAWRYRRSATKVCLAERFAGGVVEVVDLLQVIFGLATTIFAFVYYVSDGRGAAATSRPWVTDLMKLIVAINVTNVVAFVKGF